MRTLTCGAWFRRRLVAFVVALGAGLPGPALRQDVQRQVLVLYSARRDAQIVTVGEREFPRILDQRLREGLDSYSEYIDRSRFPEDSYKTAFRDFLRLKYQDKRFDVIIAVQDLALEFVRAYRTALFGDSSIDFSQQMAVARHP